MSKERNYGIDLLRLVLMLMVCMLHTLGQGGVLISCEIGTLNYKVYWLLEILSYCAVDGFAIISGYMAPNRPVKYEKIVEMWFQVFFYTFILTVVFSLVGLNHSLSKIDIIKCGFPVLYDKVWYFTAFFALYVVMPLLNKFLFAIDEVMAKKTLIVTFTIFSVGGAITYSDPFRTLVGESSFWIIILYCIGVLAKKAKLFETRKSMTLIVIWACCILATWGEFVFWGTRRLLNYVAPTILLSGLIMVVLFARIKIKGTVISKLSPLAFGVYLFQLNPVLWNDIVRDAMSFVVNRHIAVGVAYVFAFAILVFVSGLLVDFLRSILFKLARITLLSRKIVEIIEKCIMRLFVLIK